MRMAGAEVRCKRADDDFGTWREARDLHVEAMPLAGMNPAVDGGADPCAVLAISLRLDPIRRRNLYLPATAIEEQAFMSRSDRRGDAEVLSGRAAALVVNESDRRGREAIANVAGIGDLLPMAILVVDVEHSPHRIE